MLAGSVLRSNDETVIMVVVEGRSNGLTNVTGTTYSTRIRTFNKNAEFSCARVYYDHRFFSVAPC